MNAFLKYFRSSQYKNLIKFTGMIEVYHQIGNTSDPAQQRAYWDSTFIPNMVAIMKDPQYFKVLNGRPLVFFHGETSIVPSTFSSDAEFKAAVDRLRNAAKAAGLPNPYIVGGSPSKIDAWGEDGVWNYNLQFGNGKYLWNNGQVWPYTNLVENFNIGWNEFQNSGKPYIPTMMAGWGPRPNRDKGNTGYGENPSFQSPTQDELSSTLANSIAWVQNHSDKIPSQVLYVYSWAELGEGT